MFSMPTAKRGAAYSQPSRVPASYVIVAKISAWPQLPPKWLAWWTKARTASSTSAGSSRAYVIAIAEARLSCSASSSDPGSSQRGGFTHFGCAAA